MVVILGRTATQRQDRWNPVCWRRASLAMQRELSDTGPGLRAVGMTVASTAMGGRLVITRRKCSSTRVQASRPDRATGTIVRRTRQPNRCRPRCTASSVTRSMRRSSRRPTPGTRCSRRGWAAISACSPKRARCSPRTKRAPGRSSRRPSEAAATPRSSRAPTATPPSSAARTATPRSWGDSSTVIVRVRVASASGPAPKPTAPGRNAVDPAGASSGQALVRRR